MQQPGHGTRLCARLSQRLAGARHRWRRRLWRERSRGGDAGRRVAAVAGRGLRANRRADGALHRWQRRHRCRVANRAARARRLRHRTRRLLDRRVSAVDQSIAGTAQDLLVHQNGPIAMMDVASTTQTESSTVIVDLDGVRAIGVAEAQALLLECLALTHRRLDTMLRSGVETLQVSFRIDTGPGRGEQDADDERAILCALRMERTKFVPRFLESFEGMITERLRGTWRREDKPPFQLGLVDLEELNAQLALKDAVHGLYEATADEIYALDYRVRALMREPDEGAKFDNPWDAHHFCDALGATCRELWPERTIWRPIMMQLSRLLTPHAVVLYHELNAYLQDRDVFPALRAKARGGQTSRQRITDRRDIFSTLVGKLEPTSP